MIAALAAIRKGDVSTQELTSLFLARIESENPALGALRHVAAEEALKAARAIDALVQSAAELPPLAGLPVVVKENCDTAGMACSAGLTFRAGHVPSADSAVTARLRAAGAIILGVSVSDPGAFGVRTAEVTHPLDASLSVGGSSGGSGAALAAGFCLGAIGTDTGGSIRIPSACCGIVGLKPTYGTLPMDGIFPLVPSLDHVGPMARSVADVRLFCEALSGERVSPAAAPRIVGYDPRWVEIADEPISSAFRTALDKLQDRGIATREVALPNLDDVAAMHGQIFMVEAAAWHCAHHGESVAAYPEIAREWFALARQMPVGAYVEACTRRVAATRAVDRIFQEVDVNLTPTICVARPPRSAQTLQIDGRAHDYIMAMVRLTCLFDHTGHPALSLPVPGTGDILTSSVQIVGPRRGEDTILQTGLQLELDQFQEIT